MHHAQAARVHRFHQRARNCRAAAHDGAHVRKLSRSELLQKADPDRRHAGEERRLFAHRQIDHRFGVAGPAIGEDERRSGERRRVRNAPRVGVKRRHDRKDHIRFGEAEGIALKLGEGVEQLRAMRIDDAFRIAGRSDV